MMNPKTDDYKKFIKDDEKLSNELSSKIFVQINKKINPKIESLLPKFIISFIVGAVATLSVCPQFGIGPLIGEHGLGHLFMSYGETICAAFCGAFFLSISTMVAFISLKSFERKVIFDYEYRVLSCVSVFFFLIFMILNKTFELPSLYNSNFSFVVWWISGLMSAVIVSKFSRRLGSFSKL